MIMKFTDRFIQSVRCESGERIDLTDDKVSGLSLRVMFTGKKSWSFRYRRKSDSKLRRVTIGEYPTFSLSDARNEAFRLKTEVAEKKDPAKTAKRPSTTGPRTFGELAKRYLENYATHKRSGDEDRKMLEKDVLPALEGEPLGAIERADIASIVDAIIQRGAPVRANRTFSVIRKVFNWGIEKGYLEYAPTLRMKPPAKEESRDRFMTREETKIFCRQIIANVKMSWILRMIFKLLLVTGQRVMEVAGAKKSEFDFERLEWHIPKERLKNKMPVHVVPLSPLAAILFKRAIRRSGDSEYVFPSPVTGVPIVNTAPAFAMQRNKSVFAFATPITPHDLRRTMTSNLSRLRFSRLIQDKILNHVMQDKGISGVYDRYAYGKEKREALEAWADYLQEIVFDRPRAVVVSASSVSRAKKPSSP